MIHRFCFEALDQTLRYNLRFKDGLSSKNHLEENLWFLEAIFDKFSIPKIHLKQQNTNFIQIHGHFQYSHLCKNLPRLIRSHKHYIHSKNQPKTSFKPFQNQHYCLFSKSPILERGEKSTLMKFKLKTPLRHQRLISNLLGVDRDRNDVNLVVDGDNKS